MNKPSLSGQRIGFVGLGNMGAPMARHLATAGAQVFFWNRSDVPAATAEALGMTRVGRLSDVGGMVGSSLIGINLTKTEVVESVVFGPEGLFGGLVPGTVLVDFGTTGVEATRTFAERCREQGCGWVDAPVSGGQVGAEAATLTIMAGGDDSDVAKAMPMLQTVGAKVTHLGPSGAGQVTKLANQLIVAQTIDAVAQALALAEKAGVDPAKVREALRGGFAESRILELHGDRMVRRDFRPGGRAELQLKDVRLMSDLAGSLGLDFPTLRNSLARWEEFVESRGFGDLDHSGLWTLYGEQL